MRSGDFPGAMCVASINGFVVSIPLPRHPDNPGFDTLYPKLIDGIRVEQWLKNQPEVAHVFSYRENASTIDIVVVGKFSTEEQANMAQRFQDAINAAGFQW